MSESSRKVINFTGLINPKIICKEHKFLEIAETFAEAMFVLAMLMTRESRVIVAQMVGTSKTQMHNLKKWAREFYFVAPIDGGFIVTGLRPEKSAPFAETAFFLPPERKKQEKK
jgi:hypothetical protein